MKKKTKKVGIVLTYEVLKHIDILAEDDMRDRSAELSLLIDAEWKRRETNNGQPQVIQTSSQDQNQIGI